METGGLEMSRQIENYNDLLLGRERDVDKGVHAFKKHMVGGWLDGSGGKAASHSIASLMTGIRFPEHT